MNYYVEIFEDNAGGIQAVVMEMGTGNPIVNIITGIEHDPTTGDAFIAAARAGFEFADTYDPEEYQGLTMEEMYEELDRMSILVAQIWPTDTYLEKSQMGAAAKKLFRIED